MFLDESGVTTSMTRTLARAPRGQRATDQVPRNRGTVTTLLGAMTTTEVVAMMSIEAGTTTEVFEAFLRNVLLPKLEPGTTVVMDNLGAHRAKRIAALLDGHGIEVRFTLPSSPEFNPIELFWGWLKARLRTWKARSVGLLDTAVGLAMQELPAAIAAAWAVHTGYPRECQ